MLIKFSSIKISTTKKTTHTEPSNQPKFVFVAIALVSPQKYWLHWMSTWNADIKIITRQKHKVCFVWLLRVCVCVWFWGAMAYITCYISSLHSIHVSMYAPKILVGFCSASFFHVCSISFFTLPNPTRATIPRDTEKKRLVFVALKHTRTHTQSHTRHIVHGILFAIKFITLNNWFNVTLAFRQRYTHTHTQMVDRVFFLYLFREKKLSIIFFFSIFVPGH